MYTSPLLSHDDGEDRHDDNALAYYKRNTVLLAEYIRKSRVQYAWGLAKVPYELVCVVLKVVRCLVLVE